MKDQEPIGTRDVWITWLPLAASWLLMAAELPLLSAVVARLAHPEINLAAYGGLVFPLALVIESPIIMLLAASTALCKEWDSYQKIHRVMMWSSAVLTGLHVAIAFSPVFDFIATRLIQAPESIIEPARIGFQLMIPWTWAIAHRRFHQGVLIRFGRSRDVGWGTGIRLSSGATVLTVGFLVGNIPGIVVATAAVSTGVIAEALFIFSRFRAGYKSWLKKRRPKQPLTYRGFIAFYLPLAITPFCELAIQPIAASSISRMPLSLESLAVWPAMHGLVFLFRSVGLASNEVVISLLDRPGGSRALGRFTLQLATLLFLGMALLVITPLGHAWFDTVSGLKPDLASFASKALWLALLLPVTSVMASWFQGNLVRLRKTRAITESMILFLGTCSLILYLAVQWGHVSGLYAGLVALTLASLIQITWQARRLRQYASVENPT